ncbi:MAG: entericidin A/B family lipoprotein [Planctomycetota bacterium]|jgi:predicted small secreted protein
MIKKVFLMLVLAVLIFSLAGCQTMAGFGEDITWTAETTADLLEGEY